MTEYRVVATIDTLSLCNGERHHHEAANCWFHGRPQKMQTFDKGRAEEFLAWAEAECPKFDEMTQAEAGRNAVHYWQTNIRIQSREVTEWR